MARIFTQWFADHINKIEDMIYDLSDDYLMGQAEKAGIPTEYIEMAISNLEAALVCLRSANIIECSSEQLQRQVKCMKDAGLEITSDCIEVRVEN